jgi:hypothetical protein
MTQRCGGNGLGGWIGGGVRVSDQGRCLRGEAAQPDGLCVTCMVTQHMLRIDSPYIYIHTHLGVAPIVPT